MLMRTDPFREMDRIVQQLSGTSGTWSKPSVMPMDAYRQGDTYVIAFDLPGVSTEAIDIDVERNMLTVKAERHATGRSDGVQMELSERPLGVFSRQLVLADTLDTERIEADYDAGVLTLRIPIAERAKPRKIAIGGESGRKQISRCPPGGRCAGRARRPAPRNVRPVPFESGAGRGAAFARPVRPRDRGLHRGRHR